MSFKNILLVLFAVILLTGCATYGLYDANGQLNQYHKQPSTSEKGYLIFSNFDVPQATKRSFYTYGGIAGITYVDIYDVTNELNHLGGYGIVPPIGIIQHTFMEQHLSIGKHIFMLIHKYKDMGDWVSLTDFIEVNITKEQTTHIAISLYKYKQLPISGAWIHRPKFTQIMLDEKSFEFCMENIGDEEVKKENLLNFMKRELIDSKQLFFKSYCQSLNAERKSVFFLTEKNRDKFIQEKSEIEEIYKRDYPLWKNSLNKNRVFPIIQPEWILQQKTK